MTKATGTCSNSNQVKVKVLETRITIIFTVESEIPITMRQASKMEKI